MKLLYLIAAVLSITFSITIASAQSGVKFHSQNYIGIIGGDDAAAILLQSINGIKKGTWFAGVGTGVDYYFFRTVPLFLSFTKYLGERKNSFYLTADGGTHFMWDQSTGNIYNGFRDYGHFNPSLYYGASAGYRIGVKNKNALLLNVGYSAKYIKEHITGIECMFPPCIEMYEEKYNYKLGRYSFKMGWMF